MNWQERSDPISLDEYHDLDDDVRREIEVVDGVVVRREKRGRPHQKTAFRLAESLEGAVAKFRQDHRSEHAPCYEVNSEVDVLPWEVPLTIRKPDVVVHYCLDPFAELTATETVVVAEVISRWSESRDRIHKMGEYAKAGIAHYLIVEFDAMGALSIEHYALLGGARTYSQLKVTHRDRDIFAVSLTDPFPVQILWQDLDIAPRG
jgi:Uma2 family endonuclease